MPMLVVSLIKRRRHFRLPLTFPSYIPSSVILLVVLVKVMELIGQKCAPLKSQDSLSMRKIETDCCSRRDDDDGDDATATSHSGIASGVGTYTKHQGWRASSSNECVHKLQAWLSPCLGVMGLGALGNYSNI